MAGEVAVREPWFKKIDWLMMLTVFVLVAFGLIMLYSASSYNSQLTFGSSSTYVTKQIKSTAVGLIGLLAAAIIPYRLWKKPVTWVIYALTLLSVCGVMIPSISLSANGARRWIQIGGISFQPAELVKVGVIMMTALLVYMFRNLLGDIRFYLIVLAFIGLPAALIAIMTDDLGSTVIVFAIGFVMLAVMCPNRWFVIGTIAALIGAVVVLIAIKPYRLERVLAWIHLEEYADDEGFQIMQALYAIGSGGFLGKGLGKSTQKLGFVPESENDMIFSIICEENGVIVAIALLGLFAILLWRLWKLYSGTEDLFGKLLTVGVMTHIGVQTFVNVAVVTSLIPNTGVPLPFISYGGSSIIMILVEIGLVISVSQGERKKKKDVIKYTAE